MRHFPSSDIGMFGRRQRHPRGHRIPVTLVRHADAASDEGGGATIVDRFGEGDLAQTGTCSCCTVRVALQAALRQRWTEREQRPFDRVVIRTDAEPGPILRTFAHAPALGAAFYVADHPPLDGTHRFALSAEAPLDWAAFSRFVTTLTALRGADLLQVKGSLHIAGCRGPVMIQILQHLAHQPVELQDWPDTARTSRLTFTTRGLDEPAVRGLFAAVGASGQTACS
jgi:G3E family GTPase